MEFKSLPDEIFECILQYAGSKTRTIICMVSKDIYVLAMKVYQNIVRKYAEQKNLTIYDDAIFGDYQLFVRQYTRRDIKNIDVNILLHNACLSGNIDLVQLMIDEGAEYHAYGLIGACEGGHASCVFMMINLANKMEQIIDANMGLLGACNGCQIEMVEWMLRLGADNYDDGINCVCKIIHPDSVNIVRMLMLCDEGSVSYNMEILTAAIAGNIECVKLLAGRFGVDNSLFAAGVMGNIDLFREFESKGYEGYQFAFNHACKYGQYNFIKFMLLDPILYKKINVDMGCQYACDPVKYLDIIVSNNIPIDLRSTLGYLTNTKGIDFNLIPETYIDRIYDDEQEKLEIKLKIACMSGNVDMAHTLIKLGGDPICGFETAYENNQVSVAKLMIKLGGMIIRLDLYRACANNHLIMMQFLISIGCENCAHCGKSMYDHLQIKK